MTTAFLIIIYIHVQGRAKKLPVSYFENRPKLELKFQNALKKRNLMFVGKSATQS